MLNYRTSSATSEDVIVDLSALAEPLMSYEDISDLLTPEQEQKLVDYVRTISEMSHSRISRRYDQWRLADRAHDVWVPPDATRFREKAVIADTRAIADTVLTYLMAALTGRNPMFQLEGLNRKSRTVAALLERLLHQHMRRTAGEARIAQHCLDLIRYGFAPLKTTWSPDTNTNSLIPFDPRKVFPDPRVSWGDWDRMEYIVFTDHVSTSALIASNFYPKLSKYPLLRRASTTSKSGWPSHAYHKEDSRGLNIDPSEPSSSTTSAFTLGANRVIDEAWVRLSGYQIGIPAIAQIWLVLTILDEGVVIRCQLNPYGRQFPVVIGGLFNDRHKTYSQSLYDLLLPLHDISTWLLRSRIDNVQSALNNLIFADPTVVSLPDLIDRNPWGIVRTLPGTKPGDGLFIAGVPDVTSSHWNDIAAMSDMKQRLSAASDAQQGMPTSDGIRTATEIQRLSQLGSQRLGVLSRIISATSIRPCVRMQISNIQDALTYNGSMRMDPNDTSSTLNSMASEGYIDFSVSDLQGDIDYLVIDGTLPTEPSRSPEMWLNILQVLNQTGLIQEYKGGKMVEEAIRGMGLADLDQFKYSRQELAGEPLPHQKLAMLEKQRGVSTMPEDQLHREIERGNLIRQSQPA